MSVEALLDTNVLVYAFDQDEPSKNKIASELMDRAWRGELCFSVSLQNLAEFFSVVTHKVQNPISIDEANQVIKDICESNNWVVLCPDKDSLSAAIQLVKVNKLPFYDAHIAAVALKNGITKVITEDVGGFASSGLQIENPFL